MIIQYDQSISLLHCDCLQHRSGQPNVVFEPYRVDITSKGKTRGRKLNNLQPSAVQTVTYPLKFKSRGKAEYFQRREEWRISDLLFNPMVMMMIVPCLMFLVLPKLMNTADPETQKEMQQSMNMFTNPKQNMPDISETLTSWLGGNPAAGNAGRKAAKPRPLKKK
ncbi:hypothetical protein CAPTEDRAFT_208098 [Capitella teleta]|uniref:ER membrane protein complex subunit 7 beta-sandwich domain-containing protein n=1 Tax=Capitella teleta TaxID=283909 RepID=R7TNN2_CAPTE|nr:hypothetical protein CAPTEDRAFT_208098 [Capitella teleta]|eukprot:ELT92675.1 hypothetical protein CAPTEDRAFT_208098 [Capitella teleta]